MKYMVLIKLVETRQMFNSVNKNKEVVFYCISQFSEVNGIQVSDGCRCLQEGLEVQENHENHHVLYPPENTHGTPSEHVSYMCQHVCDQRSEDSGGQNVTEEVAYFCPIASWDTRRTGWTIVSIDALFEAVKIPQTPSKLQYEAKRRHRPYIGYFNDFIDQCILIGVRFLIVQDVRHKGRLKNLRVVLDFLACLADQEGPAKTQKRLINSQ